MLRINKHICHQRSAFSYQVETYLTLILRTPGFVVKLNEAIASLFFYDDVVKETEAKQYTT